MNKLIFMNKLILSLTALLIGLSALVFTLKHNVPALGSGSALKQIDVIASTTQTYFGAATGADSRATTTMLTLNNVFQYDQVSLAIEINSTTSPNGSPTSATTTYIHPQISNDFITWFDWIPPNTDTAGTISNAISLRSGTGTLLTVSPGGLGTTTRLFNFGTVVGRHMRFLVNTQATATIRLYGYLQL